MAAFRKNILVGFTVMAALGLLAWMILRFSGAPIRLLVAEQTPIEFIAPSAEGISEGSPVTYLGVMVGRVSKITRQRTVDAAGQEHDSVLIQALLDQGPPLPANVEGRIKTQPIGGGASIRLELVPTPEEEARRQAIATTNPSAPLPPIMPKGILQANARLTAAFVGYELIPPEFSNLATGLAQTADEMRLLIHQMREQDVVPELVATIREIRKDAQAAGQVLSDVHNVVGDQKLRQDIQQAVANLRTASESARTIGENLEKLSKNANTRLDELSGNGNKLLTTTQARVDAIASQMGDRLTQLAGILQQLQSASKKLNEGNGSAAQLLNNPALYENLLDTSSELKLTMQDFKRLLEQWEQEGVSFKLK